MSDIQDKNFNSDDLLFLRRLTTMASPTKETLRELFDRRIGELGILPTNVLDILKIQYRTLSFINRHFFPAHHSR